ncbi:MAG: hypothetical protein ACREQJ_09350, partial [Candidatus Binatia bacterium]
SPGRQGDGIVALPCGAFSVYRKVVRQRSLGALLLIAALAACTTQKKDAWRDSGSSWRSSGRTFLRALGFSVQGEGGAAKEEWKEFGRDTGQAGKDTAEAVGKSVMPPGEEGRVETAPAEAPRADPY